MNLKYWYLAIMTSGGLMLILMANLSQESLVSVWLLILTFSFSKMKNHFISLLLMLEMLSLSSLVVSSFYVRTLGSLNLMFILMSLSVGEAVLGLAILVKITRLNSTELILTGVS